mmetsp:Transcript_2970/g.8559  ORF Transcript_2970/g.8559 Transcript_2970/m.8559 type:complete len:517 (+) Transcript_2970:84-1634(+)
MATSVVPQPTEDVEVFPPRSQALAVFGGWTIEVPNTLGQKDRCHVQQLDGPGGGPPPRVGAWTGANVEAARDCRMMMVSSKTVRAPKLLRRTGAEEMVVTLAMKRANNFGKLSLIFLLGALAWCGIKFYLMINGENQVSEEAFRKLAESITRTIQAKVEKDLIYQDMIANVWAAEPNLTRPQFHRLVMSEAYAPGLETMTGISLIPRTLGAAQRALLEANEEAERLRRECCANTTCAVSAASGLFCDASQERRYCVTQFGSDGRMVPAVGTTPEYLERVGAEEYMVVDMIEPFAQNSKVWGFNLLSSPERHKAWLSAMRSGKKTFTRRLNLVQSKTPEFGVLVWLPLFKRPDGERTTAFDGNVAGLEAVGSVNGVYRVQHLLSTALQSTYSPSQLQDTSIFLFDAAEELGGQVEFLAAHSVEVSDPYTFFANSSIASVVVNGALVEQRELQISSTDARWVAVVVANQNYLGKRRTMNPWLALVISVLMLVGSTVERWLGHPSLAIRRDHQGGAGRS